MKIIIRKLLDHIGFLFFCIYYRINSLLGDELIIYIEYSGLGDHLFYSHIPRLIKQQKKFKKVYISLDNKYRNDEIKKLVWDLNPYVDGYKKGRYPTYKFLINLKDKNLLDTIGYMYGLNINDSEPEIYYSPNLINSLENKTLYDPNYISNCGNLDSKKISDYFVQEDIKIDFKMKLRPINIDYKLTNEELAAKTLYEFIDILFSVKRIYCLTTGTATLCAAIRKTAYVLYGDGVTLQHHHSKINNYIKLE